MFDLVGGLAGGVLRMAFGLLQDVLSQVGQQRNTVQEQALNPIQTIIQSVGGTDGVWRGVGANAFLEEVSSLTMPGIGQIGEQIGTFQSNLQRASELINQADEQASRLVQGLADTFEGIFSG